jgi:hypothetical protein
MGFVTGRVVFVFHDSGKERLSLSDSAKQKAAPLGAAEVRAVELNRIT